MATANRGQWSSRTGFILAAAGSAIGLGNIWRFPYVVGENGGAAFVLLYLMFVVVIGLPYMLAELSLGRGTQRNPVGAIDAVGAAPPWKLVGLLGVITGVGILSFYAVIAGWTVGYVFKMITGTTAGFGQFIANPAAVIPLLAGFIVVTALIVLGGIQGGIERWSKILMPVLFVLLVGLIVYANTLDGASKGLAFYLQPDMSKINMSVALNALGQAFFSLSLGMGLMVTYGSYLRKEDNLLSSALSIGALDTGIAFCAGLIIFPALFAMGQDPAAGPGLVFAVLPPLFEQMPGGIVVGALFFLLLSVAALTSTISLLEVPVTYVVDQKNISRGKVVWMLAGLTFVLAIPSALSQGASEFWSNVGWFPTALTGGDDFLSQMAFVFGTLVLIIGALAMSIFVGWVWGANKASDELEQGAPGFRALRGFWIIMIKFIVPIVAFVMLLDVFLFN